MRLELATGPVCWGVDFAGDPANPPWERVLDGIARAGYRRLELGPYGYLPTDPGLLCDALERRGLAVAGGFVFEPLHDSRQRGQAIRAAERVSRLLAATGGRYLVVIDAVSAARAPTAGRPDAAPRLSAGERRVLHDAIAAVARVAGAHGLEAAVHPHAGTFVEFADEIAAAAEVAPLCVDTGHLAWAGIEAARLIAELGDRVACLHLKDLDPEVRGRGLAFWPAVAAGIFCPLGAGMVSLEALAATEWDGIATVEQDRSPGTGDPVADLVAGREALEAAGLVAAAGAAR
jgi:inosose dehydratase